MENIKKTQRIFFAVADKNFIGSSYENYNEVSEIKIQVMW